MFTESLRLVYHLFPNKTRLVWTKDLLTRNKHFWTEQSYKGVEPQIWGNLILAQTPNIMLFFSRFNTKAHYPKLYVKSYFFLRGGGLNQSYAKQDWVAWVSKPIDLCAVVVAVSQSFLWLPKIIINLIDIKILGPWNIFWSEMNFESKNFLVKKIWSQSFRSKKIL